MSPTRWLKSRPPRGMVASPAAPGGQAGWLLVALAFALTNAPQCLLQMDVVFE